MTGARDSPSTANGPSPASWTTAAGGPLGVHTCCNNGSCRRNRLSYTLFPTSNVRATTEARDTTPAGSPTIGIASRRRHYADVVRDVEVADAELPPVAAVSPPIRGHRAAPGGRQIDELGAKREIAL